MFKIGLVIALLVSPVSVIVMAQKLYAADTKKGNSTIKVLKDKITQERESIIEDGCKLREAKKTGNKVILEQVKQETSQDIANRKARIKALYKEMDSNPWNKNNDGKKKKNPKRI